MIILKYIQIYLKLLFSEPIQRHDNYAEQAVTDCYGDDGRCEVEERTSGVTDTLLQEPDMTENVKKLITFAPAKGNKPVYLWAKTLNSCDFPLFTVVNLNLIIRTEQHKFITEQYASGNSEVKIEEEHNQYQTFFKLKKNIN